MFLNIKHKVFFCVLTSVPLDASVFGVNLSLMWTALYRVFISVVQGA